MWTHHPPEISSMQHPTPTLTIIVKDTKNMITVGSPKQKAWATGIKRDCLKRWKLANPNRFQQHESSLANQTSARWWIDNKDVDLDKAISSIAQPGGRTKVKSTTTNSPEILPSPTTKYKNFISSSLSTQGDWYRYVGPTIDTRTGKEVKNDPDCPF